MWGLARGAKGTFFREANNSKELNTSPTINTNHRWRVEVFISRSSKSARVFKTRGREPPQGLHCCFFYFCKHFNAAFLR